jgi:hypothetical protein
MDFAPWRALGEQVIQAGEPLGGVSGGATAALEGIAQDGYFLTKLSPKLGLFVGRSPERRRSQRDAGRSHAGRVDALLAGRARLEDDLGRNTLAKNAAARASA